MPDPLFPLHVLTPQEKIALEIDYDRIRLLNDELRQLHKKKQKLRDEIFRWNVRRSYRKWRLRYKGGCVRGRGGQGPRAPYKDYPWGLGCALASLMISSWAAAAPYELRGNPF